MSTQGRIDRRKFLTGATALSALAAVGESTSTPTSAAFVNKAPATLSIPRTPPMYFDARFDKHGFAQYKNTLPTNMMLGRDYGVKKDPVSSRTVAWFSSAAHLTHGNEHSRASVESPARVLSSAHGNTNATYVHRFAFYLPSQFAFTSSSQWSSVGEVHGNPWNGPSRTALMLVYNPVTKNHFLRMGNDKTLLAEKHTIVPLDTWVDVMVHFNYNYKNRGGWVKMYMTYNDSSCYQWRSVPIAGNTQPYRTDVISSTEGDGWYRDSSIPAATPRIGVYGNSDTTLYYRYHKLTTDPRSALGQWWDGKIDGVKKY